MNVLNVFIITLYVKSSLYKNVFLCFVCTVCVYLCVIYKTSASLCVRARVCVTAHMTETRFGTELVCANNTGISTR